ncbi:MAG TPA: phosphopantetheine-binding protein, partial [Solirubrobacteraceae bacterium]|nr:phosphopantetheine-binding protein [Solirubrobacteraceae bacterium]
MTTDLLAPMLERMRRSVAELLCVDADTLALDEDLIGRGIDSISMIRLAGVWRREGMEVRFSELVERPTLRAWQDLVLERAESIESSSKAENQLFVDELAPFDLATLQLAYWIGRGSEQPLSASAHFYGEFDGEGVSRARLEAAVRALIERHAMLRASFHENATQQIAESCSWQGLTVHDLRKLDRRAVLAELETLRERLSHRRLDVEHGQCFDIQLSLLPEGRTRMHVDIDMLVADAQSFRTLLADL